MKNKIVRQLFGITIATVMFAQMPMFVLADTYDISKGDITITTISDHEHQVTYFDSQGTQQTTPDDQPDHDPIVTGSFTSESQSSNRTVTINAAGGDANVTFSDLNIENPAIQQDSTTNEYYGTPAVITTGTGNVEIELEGTNSLTSGQGQAGLQKENEGELIIKDDNPSQNGTLDSLTATGVSGGAGIGGGDGKAGTDIIIKGGNITAISDGFGGAGIGGGRHGDGSVTIYNGNITADAIDGYGAGIGGGADGDGTVIINGGIINATSDRSSAT